MVAYEIYWVDKRKESHFIGMLPERRKKLERITKESILNWGKRIIGGDSGLKDMMYYVTVEF